MAYMAYAYRVDSDPAGDSEDAGFDVLSTEDAFQDHNHGNEVHNSVRQDTDPGVLSSLHDVCHE